MSAKGKKVFVGLSGGVDSSVAAYLLKKEGYDVTGVFIKVWQPDFVACTWQEDRLFAMRVCAELDIPFLTLPLEEVYKKEVIDYMIEEYRVGRTPNPDVLCNREVKFGAFLHFAKKEGADYIAIGPTAQNIFNDKTKEWELHRSHDSKKDQTYFLWTLSQEVLEEVLFPVGHLTKAHVRAIAEKNNLPTAYKKDSQGLCFISNVDMKEFLKHYIPEKRGDVLNEKGEVVGFHDGATFITLGERHGFTISTKTPHDQPYYVVHKNMMDNTLTVGHNGPTVLPSGNIALANTHFVSTHFEQVCVKVQSRYHGALAEASLNKHADRYSVTLRESLSVSPGQSLVFYSGEVCIGGGVIV